MAIYNKYERETIINMNDAEPTANIFTQQAPMMRKLLKLAEERPDDVKILKQTEEMLEVSVPKKYVKIRPPRFMSEEQKIAARDRMLAWQQKQAGTRQDEDDTEEDDLIDEEGETADEE